MQIAKIFLNVDNKMTGLRFAGGPSFFPGFGNGTNIPSIIAIPEGKENCHII